ncbi:hypothetical protein K491DRAFT_698476 [Lophiostoma macrostomum CBS 122681]|uniref:Uncharacterized protein n=1 Tax=Lophiostoma macrostomum CBS 122681 TaxID=1314788 RepID=A0A6A6SM55_9PLEO|nr:hypothetical protein K491DRAFT_698476 [Lophiostoma macrostomum CBS 122681]
MDIKDWINPGPIRFYRMSVDRVLRPVIQGSSHRPIPHHETIEEYAPQYADWMGRTLPISPVASLTTKGAFEVDSGLLVFWTSVAHIFIHRAHTFVQRHPHLYKVMNSKNEMISHSASMQCTTHLPWTKVSNTSPSAIDFESLVSEDPGEILALDAIVIGMRNSTIDEERFMQTLIVEWIDGIAYRRGYLSVSERKWVQLDREWRLIILG